MHDDLQSATIAGLTEELTGLRAQTKRLLRLLELTREQAIPPEPAQTGFFEAHPGLIDQRSAPETKVEFLAALLRAHLTGDVHVGLYPLLDGDLCWWLAADFDGAMAMLDALAYLKAARAWSVPAALEVSHSGMGAHT